MYKWIRVPDRTNCVCVCLLGGYFTHRNSSNYHQNYKYFCMVTHLFPFKCYWNSKIKIHFRFAFYRAFHCNTLLTSLLIKNTKNHKNYLPHDDVSCYQNWRPLELSTRNLLLCAEIKNLRWHFFTILISVTKQSSCFFLSQNKVSQTTNFSPYFIGLKTKCYPNHRPRYIKGILA